MKKRILTVHFIFFLLAPLVGQQQYISGLVFLDNNDNRVFDESDMPLSNVAVSSFDTIVQTNSEGCFFIPLGTKEIIFVIKPEAYKFYLQDNNVPDFYRLCYQESSVENFKYEGAGITEPFPDTLFFPLIKENVRDSLRVHIIGDIQAHDIQEVQYFREIILPELLTCPADFSVCLGDNVHDKLELYPAIEDSFDPINTPVYMVFGNHDINYMAKCYSGEAETHRKHFGPDYYSFNYGNTHFVVLNTVIYEGWNSHDSIKGGFSGGIHKQQLNWLKQDISIVPDNKRIVLLTHIPLLTNYSDSLNIIEVFSALEERQELIAIYGHAHSIVSWKHDSSTLWNGNGNFQGHIAGAACGGWWVGPYGPDSIPDATCYDGSPAGFFLYEFNEDSYDKQFVAGSNSRDNQLRISSPQYSIAKDSLETSFIYVNVFDGDDNTKVWYTLDDSLMITMKKVEEIDPYISRNQHDRVNRKGWTPRMIKSSHLWKYSYPKGIVSGVHFIRAKCILSNGKEYTTLKVFEVLE